MIARDVECFLRLDPSIHHQLLASRHSGINASGTISRRFVVDADGESPGHLIGFAGCSCHATPRRGLSKSEVPELGRTNRGKHASSIQDKCSCAVWYSRSFQACIVVLSRVGNRKGPASDSLTRFETGQRITGRSFPIPYTAQHHNARLERSRIPNCTRAFILDG